MKNLKNSFWSRKSIKNYTLGLKILDMALPQVYYALKIEISLPVRSLSKGVAD